MTVAGDPRDRLVELWREQVALGTTQGGGRRYNEHCDQHAEAIELLAELDAVALDEKWPNVGQPYPLHKGGE